MDSTIVAVSSNSALGFVVRWVIDCNRPPTIAPYSMDFVNEAAAVVASIAFHLFGFGPSSVKVERLLHYLMGRPMASDYDSVG